MKTYRFSASLQKIPGKGGYYFVIFPFSVYDEFQTNGSVRVLGTINGMQVDRALIPRGDGDHYIVVSTPMRKVLGVREGNRLSISIYKNEQPDVIEIPEELQEAIAMEPGAKEKYDLLTPGMQRGMIYWINSSKRTETRAIRAAEMLKRLMNGTLGRNKG